MLLPKQKLREPRQERSRAMVQAILEAAEHVFAEQGYENATVARIADRAGASVGSVYQYFPDKQALLVGVTHRMAKERALLFERLVVEAASMSLERGVAHIMTPYLESMGRDHAFRRVMMMHLPPSAERQDASISARYIDVISTFLEPHCPGLPASQRRRLAFNLLYGTEGVLEAATLSKQNMLGDPSFVGFQVESLTRLLAGWRRL